MVLVRYWSTGDAQRPASAQSGAAPGVSDRWPLRFRAVPGPAASQEIEIERRGGDSRDQPPVTRPLPLGRGLEARLGGSGLRMIRVVLADDSFLAREGLARGGGGGDAGRAARRCGGPERHTAA